MRHIIFPLLAAFFLAVTSFADEYIVPRTQKPPVIDGTLSHQEWSGSLLISGAGSPVEQRRSQLFLTWDAQNLYVAVRSATPPRGKLTVSGGAVIGDDSVEFLLDPPKAMRTIEMFRHGEFQILINSRGKFYTRHHNPGYGLSAREWKANAVIANSVKDDIWVIEIAIPAKSLGMEALSPADWRILPVRNYRTTPEIQAPFTSVGAFFDSTSYARFRLAEKTTVQNEYGENHLPSRLRVSGAEGPCILTATIGNEKLALSSDDRDDALFDLGSKLPPDGAKVELRLQDSRKNTIFHRNFTYQKPADRIWFTPEADIVLEHTFDNGAGTAAVLPEKVTLQPKGDFETIPGRSESSQGVKFLNGKTSVTFANFKVPVPGCISFWLRRDAPQPKPYRRFFSTRHRPTGYFGLQDMGSYMLLFVHQFTPQQVNIPTSRMPAIGQWTYVAVNLAPDKVEYYQNGIKIAEKKLDFVLTNEKLGDLALGGGGGDFSMDDLVVYSRCLKEAEIKILSQGEKIITGDISFYPSINALVADINCRADKIASAALSLTLQNSRNKTVFTGLIPLKKAWRVSQDGKNLAVIHQKLPMNTQLPDGEYLLSLTDPESKNLLLEKIIKVKKYPWLNNTLGRKERIIPPFSPLKAAGNRISCILRETEFDGTGLPAGIIADGKEILAGPVRFLCEEDKGLQTLKSGTFSITEAGDTAVSFTGNARGALVITVKGKMEFDGMTRLDMEIAKGSGPLPKRLLIDIPVKKQYAVLFHAVGEGLRSNPAGFLPAGNGTIWKSTSIHQLHFDNFIPYIWVGDDIRGICYAADWDKDWLHGKEHSAVELFRHPNGDVSIRLNLLNHPKMERTHRISIALMASPVKPMPTGWRGWNDGVFFPGTKVTCPLSSPPYWGSFNAWTARYPTFGEFEYIRKLRETLDTGVIDTAYRDNWIQRVKKVRPKDYPGRVENHTKAAFNMARLLHAYKDRAVIYPYTCNAESATNLEEYPVMCGEWKSGAKVSIDSYADYAIYYLKEMLKAGFNGIYDDNTFFTANYNWATGDAYIDDNGVVHPSLGLWKNRQYIKRQAFLMDDLGIQPWITVHHTNANILPVLAMATNTMGMEWKYGMNDFQERFSPDYIRAVCQGLQGGFFPTALDGIVGKDKQRCKEASRTMLAALLSHEVRPTWPRNSDNSIYMKISNIFYDFGTYAPDCIHSSYWEEDSPVKPTDKRLLCSAYRRGKKMLLFCGSYIPGDAMVSLTVNRPLKSARNAETGESCVILGGNTISLSVKKHDFALLELEFLN